MNGSLRRRIAKIERANGVLDVAAANRWLTWDLSGREGPEPAGREAANALMRRALLELADD